MILRHLLLLHAKETEISSGRVGHWAQVKTFFTFLLADVEKLKKNLHVNRL